MQGPAAGRDPRPEPGDLLENEILYGQSFDCPTDEDFILPIGKAKVEREGSDVTVVAYSITVGLAMQAAEQLAGMGISAEVVNLRSLRPLDTETIARR
jgi:pyruvate dehydrogenase E1 component beta subunit